MRKTKIILALAISVGLSFTSCSKDPVCKQCSAIVVQTIDGEQSSTTTISATELCGEQLEALEKNLVQTVEQTIDHSSGSFSQKVVTTYTCK